MSHQLFELSPEEKQARDRAARRRSLSGQANGLQRDISSLEDRKAKLVVALQQVRDLMALNDVRRLACNLFLVRMYVVPSAMSVSVYSSDWAGAAAMAFAQTHTQATKKLADAATHAMERVAVQRTLFEGSNDQLRVAYQAINTRIIDLDRTRSSLGVDLNRIQGELASIPT